MIAVERKYYCRFGCVIIQNEDYILAIAIISVVYDYRDRIYKEYMKNEFTEEVVSKIVDLSMKFTGITEQMIASFQYAAPEKDQILEKY